jgi:FkbM family methyltransferase
MDQRIATYVVCASLILVSSIYVLVYPQAVEPATAWLQQSEHVAGDMPPGCRLPGNTKAVWPMHVPAWYRQTAVGAATHFSPARQGLPEPGGTHHSQQGEDQYAYSKFFHGKVAGSYLEMGALDGQRYSNTRWYHTHLAWHGLLIEGDPKSYAALPKNRPNDITVHAAVCEQRKTVHFAESSDGAVSGILEFMSADFKRMFAGHLDTAVKHEVVCLPLRDILAYYNITHVDFFSLDVEGGELMVLESINFSCVSFDVLVVELDNTNPHKDEAVRKLLSSAGYKVHSRVHNNDWFVREGFVPSVAP